MAEDKKRKRDPYDIVAIFEAMALDLIASLKRNFQRHKEEEMREGFRWDRWQLVKLRNMLKYRKANTKIVRRAVRDAQKLAEDVIQESYQEGQQKAENEIRRLFGTEQRAAYEVSDEIGLPVDEKPQLVKPDYEPGKVPYDQLPKAQPETQFFGMNEKKLEALQETVKNDLQQAEYGVLRKMDDVYRQVIYRAEVNMAAGAKTLDQAIDMATKEFLERGIDTITYSDGRKVDIAAWAEMALRTASQRATFLGEGKKRDEWGIYTVIMSAHDNCSPWCLPYQGTVMIDDVYTSLSPEQAEQLAREMNLVRLSEAMRNGAFHPNCRHTLSTYFPDISRRPDPADEAKAKRNYEAERRQRYIERQIRKYKRLEAGSLDPDNQARYARKVKEWQAALEEHLEANPDLRRAPRREKVEGGLTEKERTFLLKADEEYRAFKEVLGDDIPDRAAFDRLRNSEDWPLVQLDYRRRKRLLDNPDVALPNVDKATAADEKFTKYLFNPENKKGWAKGVALTSRLGYNADNWKELQKQVLRKAKVYPATYKRSDQFGDRYEQLMVIYGPNGRLANAVVAWNVSGNTTKMTSLYVKEAKDD